MKRFSNRMRAGLFACLYSSALVAEPHPVPGAPSPAVKPFDATMLLYEEKETGTGTYPVRMFVTADFVRSDDGIDDGGFLLYDRGKKILYSVVPDERRILVLTHTPVDAKMPASLALDVKIEADREAPAIGGRQVFHYSLASAGEVCQQATVVPGLLDDVVDAMSEVRSLLAGRQYRDLDKTPELFRTPCFLANYVYASGRNLEHGFPIQESNNDGLMRILVDYDTSYKLDPGLLELPGGFREFTMP